MAVCDAIGEAVYVGRNSFMRSLKPQTNVPVYPILGNPISRISGQFLLVESGFQLKESGIPNPSSTEKNSENQYLKFGIHRVESRIQDCLEFSCMGRFILVIENIPCLFDSILVQKKDVENREIKHQMFLVPRTPTESIFNLQHDSHCACQDVSGLQSRTSKRKFLG